MFAFKSFIILAIFASLLQAHICVWEPRQRGPLSIDQPGDPSCYRPYPLCGNQSAEAPITKLLGGSTYEIHFQQNLNHWTAANPGFLDATISLYKYENFTESDFIPLGSPIPDYNARDMIHQTNFTIVATIPNVNADHAVIRLRYQSNNPDEVVPNNPTATFYQCADVMIVQSSAPPKPIQLKQRFRR